ncbi:MAG: hypothetical protein LKJ80_02515 [Oscillibacter sp.]|nr:hypothetical protein [Oscillibacter sp.]
MSISAEAPRPRSALGGWLAVSGLCAVFALVYEFFSHGVYSAYMLGLPLFPLLLGALPALLGRRRGALRPAVRGLWRAGVAALGTGSCVAGILEIYGTTSPYVPVYWAAGLALLAAAAAVFFAGRRAAGR